jgi:class 3 adenylate cyclase
MRCLKCGVENREGRKFCAECGAAFSLRCPSCGTENTVREKFCGECGAALAAAASGSLPKASEFAPTAQDVRVRPAESDSSGALEGERKTVTALFADIKGSMELMEDLDPEEARAIVDPALKLMIDAAHRYGGYIVQSTGDGIFALFGAPIAHEDYPQRAVFAALRMQEDLKRYSDKLRERRQPPLSVRVGVNSGEVVVRSIQTDEQHTEYTPIGHSISLASRLQTFATPGSVVIGESVRKFVEGYFILKTLGPTQVKGVSEPVNIYEVTSVGPLRTRLQRAAGRGLTRFVGRAREMDAMKAAAEQARAGRGQIVAAMAEPGVGKSRLLFEFKAVSQSSWMVLEAFSASHGKASAYLPVIEVLHSYFQIAAEDDARERREKVAEKIAILDRTLEVGLPYLYGLLGIVDTPDPIAQMDAQTRKRRTHEAIKRMVLRESLNQPLMIIFEDLHWIDDETQELLNLLADSIATAKILLLVSYRPEYKHEWGNKTYYTQLRLDPLGHQSAEEMLSSIVGDSKDLLPLKRLIMEKTECTPFFMEETVQMLLDDGALVRNGSIRLIKPLAELKIPPTVQDILAARIDRLPPEEKELLQALSVLGREFTINLLKAVVSNSDDELNQMLNDLQVAEFIYEQPVAGNIQYIFKHGLTQEVAYNSILLERRKLIHARTGAAIEAEYTNHLEDHIEKIGYHYSRSGNARKTAQYMSLAANQALKRSAYSDAMNRAEAGLDALNTLPESTERDSLELELIGAISDVLCVTKGYTSREFIEATARGRAMAEKSGNLAQLIHRAHGTWAAVQVSGDYTAAAALADQELDLAEREGSAAFLGLAHVAQLTTRYWRGDLVGAEEYFKRGTSFFGAPCFKQFPGMGPQALGYSSLNAWTVGSADTARDRIRHAITIARDGNSLYENALAQNMAAELHLYLRDPEQVETLASRSIALSDKYQIPLYKWCSRICLGRARSQLGHTGGGVALVRQGLAGMREIGAGRGIARCLTYLAEAQALDGAMADASETIEQALKANPAELAYRPETLRVRGELCLKTGSHELAEADFREAVALAQKMSAKAWELRATMSLARLLGRQGKRDEARAMLAEIYNWFTEGFDTADLKDAKALLEELRNRPTVTTSG